MFSMVSALMRQSYSLDVYELQTTLLRDVRCGFLIFDDCIEVILYTISHWILFSFYFGDENV